VRERHLHSVARPRFKFDSHVRAQLGAGLEFLPFSLGLCAQCIQRLDLV
jgi:hypothetical protein